MFGSPKPAFGQTTNAFGGFNTANTASPFGQNTFGKPAGTGFATTPAFGAPTTGTTLFGTPAPATGGLFGQPTTQTGFGFSQNTSGGLFNTTPSNTSLFGQKTPGTQTFGTNPTGFGGFGASSTPSVGGLFGSSPQLGTGLFGQPATATTSTTGLFGSSPGFGGATQSGTYIKYAPVSGTDMVMKNGQTQNIQTQHHCITCMKEYENKSLEELRYEDYLANRKGGGPTSLFGSAPVGNTFGQQSTSGSLFGQPAQDKPGGLFGQNNTSFGQSTGVFGKQPTTGFGAQPATSNTFAFGPNTANQSTSLFGQKPFGATPAPAFATTTQGNTFRPNQPTAFGNSFGNMQPTANIFGAKPPENNTFGLPQTSTASFGNFGATPAQDTSNIFGAKINSFGTAAPVFGAGNAFGAPATGTNTGSVFSNFGAKPAETGAPAFNAFNPTPGANTGMGLNLSGGGLFGAKPATNMFNAPGTTQTGGIFGSNNVNQLGVLGNNLSIGAGGSTFGNANTGLGTFGAGGLNTVGNWAGTNVGGGLGNLGGGGLGTNTTMSLGGNLGGGAGPGFHDRLISLTRAYPYGYSALLKDLSPRSEKIDDFLKPTNPTAQRTIMESDKYRVTPGVTKLKVKPLHATSKKSLFDGLEEDDPTIQKFVLKPNVKRLVLRPKPAAADSSTGPENSLQEECNDQNNVSTNDVENIPITDSRVSISSPLQDLSEYERESNAHTQKYSPTNIQKRVGLDSPRGGILKNSLNISSDAGSNDELVLDRRGSWLTKPLNKRSSDVESVALDDTVEQLLTHRNMSAQHQQDKDIIVHRGMYPDLSAFGESNNRSIRDTRSGLLDVEDKENIENPASNDDDIISDEQSMMPHPTGIKLIRPGYYTIPSLEELKSFLKSDGKCIVPQFTIGRRGYGNVFFDCEMDVSNLDIDQLVHILNKEIIVYPDDDVKPPVGEGLNRPAQVTLDCIWPVDKTTKVHIKQPEKLAKMEYEGKLRKVCNKHGTRFIEYRPQTGSWVFKVPHFSKYGLTNSDEEDEGQPDGTQAKVPVSHPAKFPPQPALRGLGGFLPGSLPGANQSGLAQFIDHNDQTMDSVSADIPFVSRLNGTTKGLAMDTSEENSMDSAALYPEVGQASFYGSKDATSPTSQLARIENQNSHTLQLMKASFFNSEQDFEDAGSVTDQMVPQLSVTCGSVSTVIEAPSVLASTILKKPEMPLYSGLSIRQPIIKPKSVVLQYHKKVLPYRKTIAGQHGHGCYADLAIAMARFSRISWGPSLQFTAFTTTNAIADKSLGGNLLSLQSLVQGRLKDDCSKQMALRLHIAGGGPPNNDGKFKESIDTFLRICLDYSNVSTVVNSSTESCPHISPSKEQLKAITKYLEEATRLEQLNDEIDFGISPSYCREVWSLCLALWGEHGDPDVDPNLPNGRRLLDQYAALSDWLQTASAAMSEADNTTVFSLLAARQIYDACELAHKTGDHYMAIMLSQIGGELRVRNLAARQLGLWRETCADQSIDPVRLVIYGLLAGRPRLLVSANSSNGRPTTLHVCSGLDWIRAFGLHFWYICEQIPTVADAIRLYEKSFLEESRLRKSLNNFDMDDLMEEHVDENDDEFDFANAETDDILYGRVPFPSPPYDNSDDTGDEQPIKKILDLRYQLMALRASRWRSLDSILNPASHTPDPLDYRLSWLVQQFLEGIGYSHWSERGLYNIISGFATQLESQGMWPWAIFVLQHIKDEVLRNRSVKEVVMRYAGNGNDSQVENLLNKLGIPKKWVYQAEALKAKYRRDGEAEAQCLTFAGQYAEAHKVIINQLAPTFILNEKPCTLRKLLKPLATTGNAGLIPNWATGGHLLLEFLDICDEVNLLKNGDSDSLSYRCEGLKMRLATACNSVTQFPTPTLKHTVARCEIGARLASIGCAIASLGTTMNRVNAAPLLNLLNRMDLPSDYIRKLLDKVSDSLTEEPDMIMYSETMSSSSEE